MYNLLPTTVDATDAPAAVSSHKTGAQIVPDLGVPRCIPAYAGAGSVFDGCTAAHGAEIQNQKGRSRTSLSRVDAETGSLLHVPVEHFYAPGYR